MLASDLAAAETAATLDSLGTLGSPGAKISAEYVTPGWQPTDRWATDRVATVSLASHQSNRGVRLSDPWSKGATTYEAMVQRARTHSYIRDEVVVAIQTSNSVAEAGLHSINWAALTGDANVKYLRTLAPAARPNGETVSLVHLKLSKQTNLFAVMRALGRHEAVMWSAPNFTYPGEKREFTPNDPEYPSQSHHAVMQNPAAWDSTTGDPSLVIAITDDGVDLDHPDLAPNLWSNFGEDGGAVGDDDDGNGLIDDLFGWDFVDNDNDPRPDSPTDAHGTHLAGVVAAAVDNGLGVAGVAGSATFMPLRIFGASGWNSIQVASGLDYAVNNGAQIVVTGYDIDAVADDPVFVAALTYLYDFSQAIHFNSAGNASQLNPARQQLTQTLLVASTNSVDQRSSSSNYGTGIDLAAPGEGIRSTLPGGTYGGRSGTSMAAANAAGVAALIWSQNPAWTREQVVAQLYATADNIDAQNPGLQGLLGGGRVNSLRAVTDSIGVPRIRLVNNLPGNGASLDNLQINNFDIAFDQVMSPSTVNNLSHYQLRGAGPDNQFNTADDLSYSLTAETYRIGTNLLNFRINQGNLPYGKYRLTIAAADLRNPFGTALDGDGNGTAGGNFVSEFTLAPSLVGSVSFTKDQFRPIDIIRFSVQDNATTTPLTVTLTTPGGDSETVTLTEMENFTWTGAISSTAAAAIPGNGTLEVGLGDTITLTYLDADTGGGVPGEFTATAEISNTLQLVAPNLPLTLSDQAVSSAFLTVSDAVQIGDLDVRLDVAHPRIGDLTVDLIAPDNTRVRLVQNVGGTGSHFVRTRLDDEADASISSGAAPFTGSFRPVQSLGALDLKSATGLWTLELTDSVAGLTGSLTGWSLFITPYNRDAGALSLGAATVNAGDNLTITVVDSNHAGPLSVTVTTSKGDSEVVSLSPAGLFTYTGTVTTSLGEPSSNSGQLEVNSGEVISVSYLDQNDGNGGSPETVETANVTNLITYRSDDDKAIVDGGTTFADLIISNPGVVGDLDVLLDLQHPRVSDLVVHLHAPSGKKIELFSLDNSAGANLTGTRLDDSSGAVLASGAAPFTGSFQPVEPLAEMLFEELDGTWRLEIEDTLPGGETEQKLLDWSLVVDVRPGNALPELDQPGDLNLFEDDPEALVVLTGIRAGQSESQPLRVTASSNNPGLIPHPGISYDSPDPTGLLTFTPVANQSGEAVITVNIEDGGLDNNLATPSDNAMFSRQFKVTVAPRNDAPTQITPGSFALVERIDTTGGYSLGSLQVEDLDSADVHSFAIVGGADQAVFSIGGTDRDELILTDGVLRPGKPLYEVLVRATDSEGASVERLLTVTVKDLLDVSQILINGGDTQRSSVYELLVRFDGLVVHNNNAIKVWRGDGFQVDLSVSWRDFGTSHTEAIIHFNTSTRPQSVNPVHRRSLVDGEYELFIDQQYITRQGTTENLSADVRFGGATRKADNFYALFGDAVFTGVGSFVNSADLLYFRRDFGKNALTFDYDGNGVVSSLDLLYFRRNFGKQRS